ncbi:hypothetical protein FRC04_004366 [Tulasnella sp. 424]|nr:hypothetical protein FRC04_004366 [Tulasnella sp. 424]
MSFLTYASSSTKQRHVYDRLPVNARDQRSPSPSAPRRSQRRVRRLVTAFATTLAVVVTFRVWIHELTCIPTYEDIKRYESRLPQHDLDLPFPEGRDGRYVKFVPYTGYGLNNELQDIIMVSQIALLANRGYVFQPYIWSTNSFTPVVMELNLNFRSAQIPLNAFISGPISGNDRWKVDAGTQNASVSGEATLPPQPSPPRSISYDWWEVVCPPERRVFVDVLETRKELGIEWGAPVKDIIERWAQKLRAMNDTCVEVSGDRLFTFFDYGEKRLLSAWDILSTSPVLKQLTWSPLVNSILYGNLALLQPPPSRSTAGYDVIPHNLKGLLAVHIRRGDFYKPCMDRLKYNSEYNGWNSFPDYPDVFDPPPPSQSAASALTSSPRADSYMRHCYPTLDQIVDRINLVRDEWHQQTGQTLDRVYVMTNAKREFLAELKRRLTTAMSGPTDRSWKAVVTTKDLSVPNYSAEVIVGADMLIGEKAEVFIGNGFSSLSSNINLIRRSNGQPPSSSRFWHSDRVQVA